MCELSICISSRQQISGADLPFQSPWEFFHLMLPRSCFPSFNTRTIFYSLPKNFDKPLQIGFQNLWIVCKILCTEISSLDFYLACLQMFQFYSPILFSNLKNRIIFSFLEWVFYAYKIFSFDFSFYLLYFQICSIFLYYFSLAVAHRLISIDFQIFS